MQSVEWGMQSGRRDGPDASGHFRAHAPAERRCHPFWVLGADQSPASSPHVGLQPGSYCRVVFQGVATYYHQRCSRAIPGKGPIAQVRQHFAGHAVRINDSGYLEWNESDLGNGQAALHLALIHFLAADRGGPGCREVLWLAGIVDQDDLLLDLLAGAEVVVFCGICPRRAGDPRQRRAVDLLEGVLHPGPGAQTARQTRGSPTAPRIYAIELLDLVVVSVIIQAVLGTRVEHPAAEQVVKILPILWFLGSIGVRAKIDGSEFRQQRLAGDIALKPVGPAPERAVHG